jgi:hypothetical protein
MKPWLLFITTILLGSQLFAESPKVIVERLSKWQQTTANRTDLEDREKDLRLDFIYRLIFQTDRKYTGGDLKDFYVETLKDMVLTDQMKSNQSYGSMTNFLESTQQVLTEILEPRESVINLLQEFTDFSGISEPADIDDFATHRSYYDGKTALEAQPLDMDSAGELPDQDLLRIDFTLANSLNPYDPSSLPKPDSLVPPKGILGSENTP